MADNRIRETNLRLLHSAQAYVKLRLKEIVPDRSLALAWEEFYSFYDVLIRRFIAAQGVPPSDVDDCVQEVWSEVAARLAEFRRPADRPGLRAWFYVLVRNKSTDIFRRRRRRLEDSLDQAMANGKEPEDTQTDPAVLCQRRWEQSVFESVVERLRVELSAMNYRIFCMRALEYRTTKEVASLLKITPKQVRYRLHRVMKKLKTHVAITIGMPIDMPGTNGK